jgi:protein-S-isoprenylcysteine O-methyltransferase Ste14
LRRSESDRLFDEAHRELRSAGVANRLKALNVLFLLLLVGACVLVITYPEDSDPPVWLRWSVFGLFIAFTTSFVIWNKYSKNITDSGLSDARGEAVSNEACYLTSVEYFGRNGKGQGGD